MAYACDPYENPYGSCKLTLVRRAMSDAEKQEAVDTVIR